MSHSIRAVTDIADLADARVARTRAAVLDAMRDLFEEEGTVGLTHQRVAQRAGVGRATIYRHWPRPVDLLLEAMGVVDEPLMHAGPGPLRSWMKREVRRAATELARPASLQITAAVMGQADTNEAIRRARDRMWEHSIVPVRHALDSAVRAGELRRAPDSGEVLAQLLGPLMVRLTIEQKPVSPAFIERLVTATLASIPGYQPTTATNATASTA